MPESSADGADIETTGTRVVYQNRWMRVREDDIRYRDGSRGIYGVVENPSFVVIAALDGDRHLHLVQQFRYLGRYLIRGLHGPDRAGRPHCKSKHG